ncbi:hypothetical protein [Nesterenkonia sandarakina]|uniref:Uncharacterized protein n=1 Tax=Nesterenkonia sandarakina TaxID=272918 RepID=A0A2T0YNY2_9MICC|nr:hypothetical protein [Nesterenkonia sandarakina]PRZ16839.1 hypothetical protein BCL67_106161 [Nesterenkonia sandarakina]
MAADRSPHVVAVAATWPLDPRDWRVRARLTRFGPLAVLAAPLTRLVPAGSESVMVPMRAVADFAKMSRSPELSELCAADPRGPHRGGDAARLRALPRREPGVSDLVGAVVRLALRHGS